MAVVDVQTAEAQAGQAGDRLVECGGFGTGRDAGAVLAHVQVEQYIHALAFGGHGFRQSLGGAGVVGGHGEATGRVSAGQTSHALAVRPDDVISQQYVRHAAAGQHFGFGQGGALVLQNAGVHRHADDLARFVRLDVRPQPAGVAGDLDGSGDVLTD